MSNDTRHCPTCICGRRATVRGGCGKGRGTVAWAEHLEAFAATTVVYGHRLGAEGIAERGGFGYYELLDLLGHDPKTWEPSR